MLRNSSRHPHISKRLRLCRERWADHFIHGLQTHWAAPVEYHRPESKFPYHVGLLQTTKSKYCPDIVGRMNRRGLVVLGGLDVFATFDICSWCCEGEWLRQMVDVGVARQSGNRGSFLGVGEAVTMAKRQHGMGLLSVSAFRYRKYQCLPVSIKSKPQGQDSNATSSLSLKATIRETNWQ